MGLTIPEGRAFAVKVEGKRLPVFPFSGLLKGCKGHKTQRFENGGTNQIRKMENREVVFLQPLPQTLYRLKPSMFHTWTSRVLLPQQVEGNVTKFAQHKALK